MDRLPASDAATLDALFAGMPRRAFWPAGPVDRSDLDELRRGGDRRATDRGRSADPTAKVRAEQMAPGAAGANDGASPPETRSVPGPRAVLEATSGPEWGVAPPASPGQIELPPAARMPVDMPLHQGRRLRGQLDPQEELDRARAELESRPERAFVRLALVLRHDPTFAPAVLELLRLRREPTAALVRGDAQRLLGRHLEAEAAFDAAAESLEVS